MSCRNYQQEISPLLDRKLSAGEQERLLAHLETCRECSSHMELLASMRKELRAMRHPSVPSQLSARLRVMASHEFARRTARASLAARWTAWMSRAQLWFDNLMRPVALPFAGGTFTATVCFSVLLPILSFSHNFGDPTFYTNADGIVVLQASDGSYQQVYDDNNFVRILRPGDEIPTDYTNVVGLTVDANGRVSDFSVMRGQLTPELTQVIMMGVFDPAEYLGSKVSTTVMVGQHVNAHTDRRGRSLRS